VEPAITKKHLGFISALVALALTLLTSAGVWFGVKAQAQDAYTMGKENAVENRETKAEVRELGKHVQTFEDTVPQALQRIEKHLEKIDSNVEELRRHR
jgi:uncharacterized protein HemX